MSFPEIRDTARRNVRTATERVEHEATRAARQFCSNFYKLMRTKSLEKGILQRQNDVTDLLAQCEGILLVIEDNGPHILGNKFGTLSVFQKREKQIRKDDTAASDRASLQDVYLALGLLRKELQAFKKSVLKEMKSNDVQGEILYRLIHANLLADLPEALTQYATATWVTVEMPMTVQAHEDFTHDQVYYARVRDAASNVYREKLKLYVKMWEPILRKYKPGSDDETVEVDQDQVDTDLRILGVEFDEFKTNVTQDVEAAVTEAMDAWASTSQKYKDFRRGLKVRLRYNGVGIAFSGVSLGLSIASGNVPGIVLSAWSILYNIVQIAEFMYIEHKGAQKALDDAKKEFDKVKKKWDKERKKYEDSDKNASRNLREIGLNFLKNFAGSRFNQGYSAMKDNLNAAQKYWMGFELEAGRMSGSIIRLLDELESIQNHINTLDDFLHEDQKTKMEEDLKRVEDVVKALLEKIETDRETIAVANAALKELKDGVNKLKEEGIIDEKLVKNWDYAFKATKVIGISAGDFAIDYQDIQNGSGEIGWAISTVRRIWSEIGKEDAKIIAKR